MSYGQKYTLHVRSLRSLCVCPESTLSSQTLATLRPHSECALSCPELHRIGRVVVIWSYSFGPTAWESHDGMSNTQYGHRAKDIHVKIS